MWLRWKDRTYIDLHNAIGVPPSYEATTLRLAFLLGRSSLQISSSGAVLLYAAVGRSYVGTAPHLLGVLTDLFVLQ